MNIFKKLSICAAIITLVAIGSYYLGGDVVYHTGRSTSLVVIWFALFCGAIISYIYIPTMENLYINIAHLAVILVTPIGFYLSQI